MAGQWTTKEDRLLAEAWAKGLPVDDIVAQLGRSRTAVWQRVQTLGLPHRNLRTGKNPEVRVILPYGLNNWLQAQALAEARTRNEIILGILRSRYHEELRELTKALAERKRVQR